VIVRFWKLSGAGNDFVLVAEPRRRALAALARRLCDRRQGVGADGLLAVWRRRGGLRLRYFNADGSEAFCGNGSRCAVWWAFRRRWAGRRMRLWTYAGEMMAHVVRRECVSLEMPEPRHLRLGLRMRACGRAFVAHALDTGVPHAVVAARGLAGFAVERFGRAIRRHSCFSPEGVNVDFVEREGEVLRLRTYERGVEGETWACGTGAVAAAVVGWRLGWAQPPVSVRVRGGETLRVSFLAAGDSAREVRLEGPAREVFQGEVLA